MTSVVPDFNRRTLLRRVRNILALYLERKGPLFARGIAYSLLLGSIPLLLLATSFASFLYGIVPHIKTALNAQITGFLPREVALPLMHQIPRIAKGWAGFGGVGMLTLILVARGIFNSLGAGLSGVMGGSLRRPLWLGELYSVVLTLLAILFVIVASAGSMIIRLIVTSIPLSVMSYIYPLLVKAVSVLLLGSALFVLYYLSAGARIDRRHSLGVSLVVSLVWHVAGFLGNVLIAFVTRRAVLYGVFAGAVLFLFWLEIFAHLVLLGGIFIANHGLDRSATQKMPVYRQSPTAG